MTQSLPVVLSAQETNLLLGHRVRALEYAALGSVRRLFRLAELSTHAAARALAHRTQVTRNVPYLGTGHRAHLLDIYRPLEAAHHERRPVVMYVHGGGFEVCSKDTHWMMAHAYANAGYVVFNVNYRLAPKHAFPRPLEDVCAAYLWLLDNAARFGGDPTRVVLAGESAGANLVSSLALVNSIERHEPWARAVYRRRRPPSAVVAACGLFDVQQPHRFRHLAHRSWAITKHAIEQVSRAYVPHAATSHDEHDLASPLALLERKQALHRPLPPFFVPCGTHDPLLDDSRRLASALSRRGVEHEARYYAGEIHAFHAMWWRAAARRCWRDTLTFLRDRLAEQERVPRVAA